MPSAADPMIQALRAVHDDLAARVGGYTDADLLRQSGAAKWTVAQVLSHLGSGAEIARAGIEATLAGSPAPEQSLYQSVWDRWNAMTPRQQADGCVDGDAALVAAYEALDDATRTSLRMGLPFLPEPVGVDLITALRLNESTLHGWDVAAADDPAAALHLAAVPVLVGALTGPLAFLIGFIGTSTGTDGVLTVHTSDPDRQLTLQVGDEVSLTPSAPDAAPCPRRHCCAWSPGGCAPTAPPPASPSPARSTWTPSGRSFPATDRPAPVVPSARYAVSWP